MKVKAIGKFDTPAVPTLTEVAPAEPVTHRRVVFETEDWFDTPVFRRDALAPGQQTKGPAIIEQLDATTVVYPGDSSIVDDWGNLIIDLEVEKVI